MVGGVYSFKIHCMEFGEITRFCNKCIRNKLKMCSLFESHYTQMRTNLKRNDMLIHLL